MKIIDLLNKISRGEEVPKKIKYCDRIWTYFEEQADYTNDFERLFNYYINEEITTSLNDEVEIIEEEPRDIEVCGSSFTRSEYNRLAGIEEDKKIEHVETFRNGWNEIERYVNLENKINEIIDYINKGDK